MVFSSSFSKAPDVKTEIVVKALLAYGAALLVPATNLVVLIASSALMATPLSLDSWACWPTLVAARGGFTHPNVLICFLVMSDMF